MVYEGETRTESWKEFVAVPCSRQVAVQTFAKSSETSAVLVVRTGREYNLVVGSQAGATEVGGRPYKGSYVASGDTCIQHLP